LDLLFRNAHIATDGVEFTGDVAVRDGVIKAIGDLQDLQAREVVDCNGRLLMPGAVDLGLNLLDNGPFDPESPASFRTVTGAAALGGVTTIVACVEVGDGEDVGDALRAQQEADSRKAVVDFGYHLFVRSVGESTLMNLRQAAAAGVCSAWAARTGLGEPQPGAALVHALAQILPEDFLLVLSPWDPILFGALVSEAARSGVSLNTQWRATLTRSIEAGLIRNLQGVLGGLRGRALVTGVSCTEALQAVEELRSAVSNLHLAATIPSLYFIETETGAPRTWPPVREKTDQTALFNALEQGLLSVVTSDHKPRTPAEMVGTQAAGGIPPTGIATLGHFLPVMLAEGTGKWRLSTGVLSQCVAADAAKLAGLYPRKGTIQPGADADLVLISPNAAREGRPINEALNPRDFLDPMQEATLQGRIDEVFLGGRRIAQAGQLVSEPTGRYLTRRLALK
jgi:dihydropyrimidinase